MTTISQIESYADGQVVLRLSVDGDAGFWLVPMSAEELETWWKAQGTFQRDPEGHVALLYRLFGETPPPNRDESIPGEFIWVDTPDAMDLWNTMKHDKTHYSCILCCDSDSYLERPDGSIIRHKGFTCCEPGGLP